MELVVKLPPHSNKKDQEVMQRTLNISQPFCCQNSSKTTPKRLPVRVKYWLSCLGSMTYQHSAAFHYGDVIMGAIASQINSFTIVYSTVYSDADQRKHQISASLAFVWGIHRRPVNSQHKWPVARKMFPFDAVIMFCSRPVAKSMYYWNTIYQYAMLNAKPSYIWTYYSSSQLY